MPTNTCFVYCQSILVCIGSDSDYQIHLPLVRFAFDSGPTQLVPICPEGAIADIRSPTAIADVKELIGIKLARLAR